MKTPFQLFREWLPLALFLAEVQHHFPGLALAAVKRLEVIEAGTPENPGGNTGYIGNNEPFAAVAAFVAFVYDGAPAPVWLGPYV